MSFTVASELETCAAATTFTFSTRRALEDSRVELAVVVIAR